MIYTIKKFFNVALKRIAGVGIIVARRMEHFFYRPDAFVGTLAQAARKRGRDKGGVINIVEDANYRMMKETISHRGFVDQTQFRVIDAEGGIGPMAIGFLLQLAKLAKYCG